jgi:hypothetical protein
LQRTNRDRQKQDRNPVDRHLSFDFASSPQAAHKRNNEYAER